MNSEQVTESDDDEDDPSARQKKHKTKTANESRATKSKKTASIPRPPISPANGDETGPKTDSAYFSQSIIFFPSLSGRSGSQVSKTDKLTPPYSRHAIDRNSSSTSSRRMGWNLSECIGRRDFGTICCLWAGPVLHPVLWTDFGYWRGRSYGCWWSFGRLGETTRSICQGAFRRRFPPLRSSCLMIRLYIDQHSHLSTHIKG